MRLVRVSWFVVLAVLVLTLVVPALRQHIRLELPPGPHLGAWRFAAEEPEACSARVLRPYQQRAAAFVNERFPNDQEMLMAAGVLADNVELLKRAAEEGKSKVASAAYVERLIQAAPSFERIGTSGVDPADPEAVKEEKKRLAESRVPDRLTPEQAEPALSALRSWQEADPDNALPVALEARQLYGLHRDKDALTLWAQAGRMPVVTSYAVERARAVQRLLAAMGMCEPEAMLNANASLSFPTLARLRDIARFAVYEGRLAAMQGDPITAITWWQSTADFGQHMQDSADTMIGFLVGIAIQGIGGAPVWRWVPDTVSGIPNGPLFRGRYFWGEHHSLYLEHMGEDNDSDLRDRLVLGKLRSQASREYVTRLGPYEGYSNATRYLGFAGIAMGLALFLVLLYLAFGSWSRRAADEATNLRPLWQFVLALLTLSPAFLGAFIDVRQPVFQDESAPRTAATLLAGLAGFVVLVLVIPLLSAISSRAAGYRFRTAWRGNLRRVAPVMVGICALVFLAANAYTAHRVGKWAEKWSAPGVTEMTEMIGWLGDKWTHPAVPPDAWRAEYPPARPK